MAHLTDILLRSLMSQELPTPPDARLVVTVDALSPDIRERLLHGDLHGHAWRAWAIAERVAFMAAERTTAHESGRSQETLRVVTIDLARETRGEWYHAGGGQWQRCPSVLP